MRQHSFPFWCRLSDSQALRDPRLITEIPPAVARAAMDSGVATRPIQDFDRYTEQLSQTVFKSGLVMKPVFERVGTDPQRVVLAEGASDPWPPSP